MSMVGKVKASAGAYLNEGDDLLYKADDGGSWWREVPRDLFEHIDAQLDTTLQDIRSG